MHEAFFFGPSNQRIFANYHPAVGGGGQVLTVVCPPLFTDYMRTHMALRELAIGLAENGQHVFRFDYRGTGDSFGELLEVTVADWIEDIALAVQEGCEISGCKQVRLLGVRAGALLACAAARASRNVQRFVLWDPILDGAGYLELLRGIQIALCKRNSYLRCNEREAAMHEYAGYAVTESMLEQFRLLDSGLYLGVQKSALHVVTTSSTAEFPVQGVLKHVMPYVCNWDMAVDELIMPRPVLECLIACLTLS